MNKAYTKLLDLLYRHDGEITHKWNQLGYGAGLSVMVTINSGTEKWSKDWFISRVEYFSSVSKELRLEMLYEEIVKQLLLAIEENQK